ncbi:MAG: thiamine pyrophosphate-dependent enzyme [Rhodoferax sp.]|uniref:thiamine pyrophosphate-dependent enzyme n=1 Tax=Rhodoferax sp. TaxID=50421 RepID=UPI002625EF46|nr:thiamine pyrophosphate-dependent enzyme [Rhodoferax sp.]MDD5333594.1 thiamine pyrophosphate-dependent enzyme [Rhodoferax sp.]
MAGIQVLAAPARMLFSGNEAVARAAWEAGVRVASAYPGTPATEMLENLANYPDIYTEWSVNEKVALEVAIGASIAGSRSFCAMKHVGLNVASDPLMTLTLTGAAGGMVIAVADDVGLSSSQNEQDSRYWGRFAHLPLLEPADSQEAYDMVLAGYALSELFQVPVILRLTTRICHVKAMVSVGQRVPHESPGFVKDPQRWVMVPGHAKARLPLMFEREEKLRACAEISPLNFVVAGKDRRVGFIASGPAWMHVQEAFPDAPALKLGFSYPAPIERIRAFSQTVEQLLVVEELEPLLEMELKAAGIACHGKDFLPRSGELPPEVLRPAVARLLGEAPANDDADCSIRPAPVFPRPPTLCAACPHLGVYYTLAKLKNITIAGDIGCYSLGAGHPWNALDSVISMGASMGVALGLDKGRAAVDKDRRILAVIGDSTFMHMGMQGLLDITYNGGNVTVLLLDNRTVGMTGGQDNPGTGRDVHGAPAPKIDFVKLCEALGVKPERIRKVDPYQLPELARALREETKIPEPSVIITDRPCVLIDEFRKQPALRVVSDQCTGCGLCLDVGCPAINEQRREVLLRPSGKEVTLQYASIESAACTGCDICLQLCAPKAIVPAASLQTINFVKS